MPVEMNHQNVRDLARQLREITGRDIKHTEIIAAIATALGRRPDAMMHELKNETSSTTISELDTPEASITMANQAGYELWELGGGCKGFGKLLKEVPTVLNDIATLDIIISHLDQSSIDMKPSDRTWIATVNYQDPLGSDSFVSTSEQGLSLGEALAAAQVFADNADTYWAEQYDQAALDAHAIRVNARRRGM